MTISIDSFKSSTPPTDGVKPISEQSNLNMTLRSALSLPLDKMAIPIYTAPQSREDVDQGGKLLFRNFVRQEMDHEGLQNTPLEDFGGAGDSTASFFTHNSASNNSPVLSMPEVSNVQATSSTAASTPEGYKSHALIEVGGRIRELADQFANSPERQTIKQHASEVDLQGVTKELFYKFLHKIFESGFTTHRLIALFFFCSDVIILSVRNQLMDVSRNFLSWSTQYIIENVCKWVHEHGGWEKVFSQIWNVAYKAAVLSALVIFIGVGVVYIKKNWR